MPLQRQATAPQVQDLLGVSLKSRGGGGASGGLGLGTRVAQAPSAAAPPPAAAVQAVAFDTPRAALRCCLGDRQAEPPQPPSLAELKLLREGLGRLEQRLAQAEDFCGGGGPEAARPLLTALAVVKRGLAALERVGGL